MIARSKSTSEQLDSQHKYDVLSMRCVSSRLYFICLVNVCVCVYRSANGLSQRSWESVTALEINSVILHLPNYSLNHWGLFTHTLSLSRCTYVSPQHINDSATLARARCASALNRYRFLCIFSLLSIRHSTDTQHLPCGSYNHSSHNSKRRLYLERTHIVSGACALLFLFQENRDFTIKWFACALIFCLCTTDWSVTKIIACFVVVCPLNDFDKSVNLEGESALHRFCLCRRR